MSERQQRRCYPATATYSSDDIRRWTLPTYGNIGRTHGRRIEAGVTPSHIAASLPQYKAVSPELTIGKARPGCHVSSSCYGKKLRGDFAGQVVGVGFQVEQRVSVEPQGKPSRLVQTADKLIGVQTQLTRICYHRSCMHDGRFQTTLLSDVCGMGMLTHGLYDALGQLPSRKQLTRDGCIIEPKFSLECLRYRNAFLGDC